MIVNSNYTLKILLFTARYMLCKYFRILLYIHCH